MIRQMITIDEEKCNGCGLCVSACQEGAIGLVNGKAVLLREDYCDGLGNCLPVCPTGAITFEEREAPAFNHEEVEKLMGEQKPVFSCPGSQIKVMKQE
ncbi:MAG: 4Fe-4S binding protein, partial [Sphaerochaeta sp.]